MMKNSIISPVVFLVAVVGLFLMVQQGQAAGMVTCGQVDTLLAPCLTYLTRGGEPGPACCDGVKGIKGIPRTTADKRQVCSCLKQAANRFSNLKDDAAQALPNKCGVQLDIPVSRNINCDLIN